LDGQGSGGMGSRRNGKLYFLHLEESTQTQRIRCEWGKIQRIGGQKTGVGVIHWTNAGTKTREEKSPPGENRKRASDGIEQKKPT